MALTGRQQGGRTPEVRDRLARAARGAIRDAVRAGALAYDRTRDLPALIRADPFSPFVETPEAVEAIVSRLGNALRVERKRACSGRWTYDLNRHIALHQAFLAETRRLAELRAKQRAFDPSASEF